MLHLKCFVNMLCGLKNVVLKMFILGEAGKTNVKKTDKTNECLINASLPSVYEVSVLF